jgi:hypothetical protein
VERAAPAVPGAEPVRVAAAVQASGASQERAAVAAQAGMLAGLDGLLE